MLSRAIPPQDGCRLLYGRHSELMEEMQAAIALRRSLPPTSTRAVSFITLVRDPRHIMAQ
jgi:hypothetical protein